MADREYIIFEDIYEKPELEPVFEACVQSVIAGKIITKNVGKKGYAQPLCIKGGDGYVIAEHVLAYYLAYLNRTGFDFVKARDFTELMRKRFGFMENSMINYHMKRWVELCLRDTWYYDENEEENSKKTYEYEMNRKYVLKPNMDHSIIPEDAFRYACYVAICFMKYGPSYASITANEIFGYVTELGSDLPAKMKKYGSGDLPNEITEYKDSEVTCKANDAFGTVKITLKAESAGNYQKILRFLNNLLESTFPRSYSITFKAPDEHLLPIKGLPKKGAHRLFAGAALHETLLPDIERYARLAMCEFEWYTDIEDENCAMPGTFAVFALGLWNAKYTELILDYLDLCDAEHQGIQNKFMVSYIEKFGFTPDTVRVFIKATHSCQELSPNKVFREAVMNEDALQLFIDAKDNFADYVFTDKDNELGEGRKRERFLLGLWSYVLYALWGKDATQDGGKKIIAKAPNELKSLVQSLVK